MVRRNNQKQISTKFLNKYKNTFDTLPIFFIASYRRLLSEITFVHCIVINKLCDRFPCYAIRKSKKLTLYCQYHFFSFSNYYNLVVTFLWHKYYPWINKLFECTFFKFSCNFFVAQTLPLDQQIV